MGDLTGKEFVVPHPYVLQGDCDAVLGDEIQTFADLMFMPRPILGLGNAQATVNLRNRYREGRILSEKRNNNILLLYGLGESLKRPTLHTSYNLVITAAGPPPAGR